MPRGPRTTKGGKRRSKLRLLVLVTAPLLLCCALFIAMDNLILYWFVLFNNDDDAEARRREDYHWYDNYGQQNPDGSGSTASPGYTNKHQSGGGLEYALNTVAASLTIEEMKTKETAMRFFIYLMDNKGYVPNAIVGAMSYMMQEGTALGTFTYESYKYCTGPSGKYYDDTLDNDAWLKWLDGSGFQQAVQLYANMRAKGSSVGYAAIGLGLTQESDVWKWDGSKGTHRATDLLNFAISKGGPWQYPNIQMMYYEQKFQGDVAWDIDQSPGVDPKSSTEVTAAEWAGRVLCGIGMPGWSYTLALDPAYPTSHESLQHHVQYVPNAQAMYDQYSGKDPWFYNADGSLKYGSTASGACAACGKVDSNDWHCPFCGPTYDNTTPQGLLIARMALLLSAENKVTQVSGAANYNAPEMVNESSLAYYRNAQHASGCSHYASCDAAASLAIVLSGVDPNFRRLGATSQRTSYCDNTSSWKFVGYVKDTNLQPGDILFMASGHIAVWLGENVAGERWPGTTRNLYEASLDSPGSTFAFFPYSRTASKGTGDIGNYYVYRATQPEWSPTYWNKFMTEIGGSFPELPRTYCEPGSVTSGSAGNASGPDVTQSGYYWPLPGRYKLSSMYGNRILWGKPNNHRGIDIPAPDGTPIYAAESGTVCWTQTWNGSKDGNQSWGNCIRIKHADGTITLYAHQNQAPIVSVGQTVSKGELVGYVGTTGNSSGNHLHLEVWPAGNSGRDANTLIDPVTIFPGITFVFNGNSFEGGPGAANIG